MADDSITPIRVTAEGRVVICTDNSSDRWILIYPNPNDADFVAKAMDAPLKRARRPGE